MKPYYQRGPVTLYHADCLEWLPTVDHGSVDAVVTDPPYGLGDRLAGGKSGEWSRGFEESPRWDRELFDEKFICGLPNLGNCIIWGGNYYSLPPIRGWLSWDKMQEHSSGHFEMAWTNLNIPTRVFRLSRVEAYSQMDKRHPTQKPLPLIEWCLGFLPHGTILDTFTGSGTTAVACIRTGRQFIGCELEEKYCEIAARRCDRELDQGRLFEPKVVETQPALFAEVSA